MKKDNRIVAGVAVAKKINLTKLQTSFIVLIIIIFIITFLGSVSTYGKDKRPSIELFNNSQTIQLSN